MRAKYFGRMGIFGAAAFLAACSSSNSDNSSKPDASTGGHDAGVVDSGPPRDAAAPPAFPAPEAGALFGAFVGAGPETEPDTQSEELFVNQEGLIGRGWVIDNRFYDDKTDWVNDRTAWDIANHIIPLITWMPFGDGDPLDEINAGQHDAEITAQAQRAKTLGTQILLRWGHEMNGNWYPWSGSLSGGDDDGGTNTGPAKYVAAWKHVHDLFVQAGATNVVWVWCINVADVPDAPWNHWTNYYPGDDYVDWVGLDAYNWGSSSTCCVWTTFQDLVDTPYQDYVGKKPMMLPETASAEVGGDKAQWITDMHNLLKTEYTDIKGVVWFDINKETDWRIASSPTALAAYKAMALDPYFSP
jgi:beta-mannanase